MPLTGRRIAMNAWMDFYTCIDSSTPTEGRRRDISAPRPFWVSTAIVFPRLRGGRPQRWYVPTSGVASKATMLMKSVRRLSWPCFLLLLGTLLACLVTRDNRFSRRNVSAGFYSCHVYYSSVSTIQRPHHTILPNYQTWQRGSGGRFSRGKIPNSVG